MSDIQAIFENLKVIRKGSEEEFELRASADEKVWGVKMFSESPSKPTYALYTGKDAQEMACDAADYEMDDEDEDEDEDDEDDQEDDDDE